MTIRTGVPVKRQSGEIIGTVSAGYFLQDPSSDRVKQMTGNEFTLFERDVRVNTTIMKDGERVMGTTLEPTIAQTVLEAELSQFQLGENV